VQRIPALVMEFATDTTRIIRFGPWRRSLETFLAPFPHHSAAFMLPATTI